MSGEQRLLDTTFIEPLSYHHHTKDTHFTTINHIFYKKFDQNHMLSAPSPEQVSSETITLFNSAIEKINQNELAIAIGILEPITQNNQEFWSAWIALATCYEKSGDIKRAIQTYQSLIPKLNSKPSTFSHLISTLNQMGRLCEENKLFDLSINSYEASLSLLPKQHNVLSHYLHLRQRLNIWEETSNRNKYFELISTGPLGTLAQYDEPCIQLLNIKSFSDRMLPASTEVFNHSFSKRNRKIKIAYMSGDLSTHAVGLLLGDFFNCHDSSMFDIHIYCWSLDDHSAHRDKIKKIKNFSPVKALSDKDLAQKIFDDQIDILIDLHGLSAGGRINTILMKPAPIIIAYLGHIGTTSINSYDYYLSDEYSFAELDDKFFSEEIIKIKECFLPIDLTYYPIITVKNKNDANFIFANFNNSYKITKEIIKSWASILKSCPNSQLLLSEYDAISSKNIEEEFKKYLKDSSQITFLKRSSYREYLIQLNSIDVYLDTSPYTAGSTAVDVIKQKKPIVAIKGLTPVARMSSSLLNHVGLDDLICNNHDEYIQKAVRLYNEPHFLSSINTIINSFHRDNIEKYTPNLVKSIERELIKIYEQKFH